MSEPSGQIIARPMLARACGCVQEFQHYAKDPFRAGRQAKFQATRCPACAAKLVAQLNAMPKREAFALLPTGATLTLTRQPDGSWAGTLAAGGATVEGAGPPAARRRAGSTVGRLPTGRRPAGQSAVTPTTEPAERHHPGRWPAGAWFGCQLGGTAWLLTGAAELCQPAPPLAAAWALMWATANALGCWLWRHRVGWPGAAPLMLLGCGAAGLAAVVALDVARPAAAGAGVPAASYLIVAGVPAVVAAALTVRRPRSLLPAVSAEAVRA